jgi:hypothetical protein
MRSCSTGVYVEDGGSLRFHEAMPPTDDEIDRLLGTINRRVHRLLARRGVLDDVSEGSAADSRDEAPVLAGVAEASVQGRRALGEWRARRCVGVARGSDAPSGGGRRPNAGRRLSFLGRRSHSAMFCRRRPESRARSLRRKIVRACSAASRFRALRAPRPRRNAATLTRPARAKTWQLSEREPDRCEHAPTRGRP